MDRKHTILLALLPLLTACTQQQSDQSSLPWWAWLLIIVGIVLLFLLLYILLSGKKAKPLHRQKSITMPMATPKVETEPAEAAVEETPVEAEVTPPATLYDKLTTIEGIGPKISAVLQGAGITTFAQLAALDADKIKQIITDAGIRLADPTTWPQQAKLAAAGDMDALKALQDSLKGGKAA